MDAVAAVGRVVGSARLGGLLGSVSTWATSWSRKPSCMHGTAGGTASGTSSGHVCVCAGRIEGSKEKGGGAFLYIRTGPQDVCPRGGGVVQASPCLKRMRWRSERERHRDTTWSTQIRMSQHGMGLHNSPGTERHREALGRLGENGHSV
jgi:hypothetical protein